MKHSTSKPTKAQVRRFEKLKELGCIVCKKVGKVGHCGPIEAHHLLSGGRRRGHEETIPLGKWHHQGIPKPGWKSRDMEAVYGPSLAKASKRFRAMFGTDDELLAEVNKLIGVSP
jgi:hypothetical protein